MIFEVPVWFVLVMILELGFLFGFVWEYAVRKVVSYISIDNPANDAGLIDS